MTSSDWGILITAAAAVATPNILAWVAAYARLSVLSEKLAQRDNQMIKLERQIAELWRQHNHQENRILAIDRVLERVVQHCNVPTHSIDWTPKESPHVQWQIDDP